MKGVSTWWWVVIAVACLLWLPFLLSKGMFVDGVYNAILAKNLAKGIGTFWTPTVNYLDTPVSWGCAPFSVFSLSIFYQLFGEHYILERVYSLICALIQLGLIAFVWKSCFSKNEASAVYSWLPVLLWLISPLTSWCYSNNLMENTMAIFTTASILTMLLYTRKETIAYPIAGSLLVFLAVLSKGPVGLFPLGAPLIFIFFLDQGNRWGWLRYFGIQLAGFILLFALTVSMEEPRIFLQHYMEVQLKPALSPTDGKLSYEIIGQLVIALSPMLILSAVSFGSRSSQPNLLGKSVFWMASSFLLIGLSASLPILLSVKQSKFYLLPSISMFSLGFALLLLPVVQQIITRISGNWKRKISLGVKAVSVVAVFISIALSLHNKGAYSRDKALLLDVDRIQSFTGSRTLLHAGWELNGEWHLFAYLNRLYDIRLVMPNAKNETGYYITRSGSQNGLPFNQYEKLYSGNKFDLYIQTNLLKQ